MLGHATKVCMAIELEHRFGKDSRVRDYWLAASEGFAVQSADGRRLGTVRQVVHERDGRAVALLVEARRGLIHTDEVVLEAEAVDEVAPWRSTLVVPAHQAPARAPTVLDRARARWPGLRRALVARVAATARAVGAAGARAAAAAHARWPAVRAGILHAWAWGVAAFVGLVGAVVERLGRLLRAIAARVEEARSAPRP